MALTAAFGVIFYPAIFGCSMTLIWWLWRGCTVCVAEGGKYMVGGTFNQTVRLLMEDKSEEKDMVQGRNH